MNFLWFVGVCGFIAQAYEGERAGTSFVTADEDNAIGLGGGLDVSLDRISSKLQQQRLNRLLSLEDEDALTGLLKSHDSDDVAKDSAKPTHSSTVEEAPRLKQVAQTTDTITLKVLKDQLSTMLSQQTALLAKQESVQKELSEIQASLHKQEARDREAQIKLDLLKSDIMSAVSRSIQEGNKQMEVQAIPRNRFDPSSEMDAGSKQSVLAALKKTLSDLKSQVLRGHADQDLSPPSSLRFSQRGRFSQQPPPPPQTYTHIPQWQTFPQYNDGAQKVRKLQDKVMRNQESWTDAGDPNYVMSVDEGAFAPQGTPLYSDQTLGAYLPDYTN